jgi:hypothetical protein
MAVHPCPRCATAFIARQEPPVFLGNALDRASTNPTELGLSNRVSSTRPRTSAEWMRNIAGFVQRRVYRLFLNVVLNILVPNLYHSEVFGQDMFSWCEMLETS